MKATGIYSTVFHYIFMFFAVSMVITSIFALYGQTIMVIAGILAMLCWGTYVGLSVYALKQSIPVIKGDLEKRDACLKWSSHLFFTFTMLCIGTAWVIGFGYFAACGPAWLAPLFHWGGLVGSIVGFCAWFIYPYVVRRAFGFTGDSFAMPTGWRKPLIAGSVTYGVWGIVWLILRLIMGEAVTNTDDYPDRAVTNYYLPYPAGTSAWVVQGNNSSVTHDKSIYAYDFRLSCGTPVVASRYGVVKDFEHGNEKGYDKGPNNFIEITHTNADGSTSVSRYLHIEKESVGVAIGDTVFRGTPIATVGNVGKSITGHIHFVVEDASGNDIPLSFKDKDVKDDDGIPRTFSSYTSENKKQDKATP